MNKQNSDQLFQRFSFFHPRRPATETLMCFGFEHDDGWFDIIWDLCIAIEKTKPPDGYRVLQVKEKFGGLRFYDTASTDEIWALVRKAEDISLVTCEICGEAGRLCHRGCWLKTLCETCRINNEYEQQDESL